MFTQAVSDLMYMLLWAVGVGAVEGGVVGTCITVGGNVLSHYLTLITFLNVFGGGGCCCCCCLDGV